MTRGQAEDGMQGYGVAPKYDSKISNADNQQRQFKYYQDYWFNTPGQEVERKK
jgi:hypothetical protein